MDATTPKPPELPKTTPSGRRASPLTQQSQDAGSHIHQPVHPSKRAREMRRAKCRQRSTETAEPTAEEVEALRVIVGRRLSSELEEEQ